MGLITGTVWHLSDLHLKAGVNDGSPIVRADVGGLPLENFSVDAQRALFTHIDLLREQRGLSDDARLTNALIISGDLVHASGWAHTDAVRAFIERLRTSLGLTPDRVLIVPGNHDVDWKAAIGGQASSHEGYLRATAGYSRFDSACAPVCFDDDGLAFLLADTVSHVGVPVNVERIAEQVHARFPTLEIDELRAAISSATATEVPSIATAPIEKAFREIAELSDPALTVSGARVRFGSVPRLPNRYLGFVVSHYPLLPCPFGSVDIKQFHLPIGAGPAKMVLSTSGVHLCLHGHQHIAWTHAEKASGSERDVRFVCISAGSLTGDDKEFNIVHYAIETETGEARVAVEPMLISAESLHAKPPRRLYVPARSGLPARFIRHTERIHDDGHVRADRWYSDVSTVGWKSADSGRERRLTVPLNIETPLGGPRRVEPRNVSDNCKATFASDLSPATPRQFKGNLSVKADLKAERVSFAYREFNTFAYCASVREKARLFGAAAIVPGLDHDEESLVVTPRIACERLEIFVRMPYRAPDVREISMVSYVEDSSSGTPLVVTAGVDIMTEATIESWPEAKRARLLVPRPLANVGYGLKWKLPDVLERDERDPTDTRLEQLIDGTEALRQQLVNARTDVAMRQQLSESGWDTFVTHIRTLVDARTPKARSSVEVTLFVPDAEILSVSEYRRRWDAKENRVPVSLVPALATYDSNDPRYASTFPIGLGIAGIVYLINWPQRYKRENYTRAAKNEGYKAPSAYIPLKLSDGRQLTEHSRLYAWPIAHPELKNTPLGVVCIGSLKGNPELDMGENTDLQDSLSELVLSLGSGSAIAGWKKEP